MLEDHLQIFLLAVFRIVDRFRASGNPNDVSFGVEDGCPLEPLPKSAVMLIMGTRRSPCRRMK